MMSYGLVTPPVGRLKATVSPRTYTIGSMRCTVGSKPSRTALVWSVSNGSLPCTLQAIGFLKWFSEPEARMPSRSLGTRHEW
jgi:hypothetical protein